MSGDSGKRDRRRLRSRIQSTMAAVEERAVTTGKKRHRVPAYLWRLSRQMVRQLARDRCPAGGNRNVSDNVGGGHARTDAVGIGWVGGGQIARIRFESSGDGGDAE